MTFTGKQILSTLDADGVLTVEVADLVIPEPTNRQVVVRMEAAPINPSDLALLFGLGDLESAHYSSGKVTLNLPPELVHMMEGRVGHALPVGNEGAGKVVAAGQDPAAQALMGQRVACASGQAYSHFVLVDAAACIPLGDNSAERGASLFVNPMTALGFVETMRMENYTGLIHTAAASNLGQMLVRICQEDRIPLVNIVRSEEQANSLRQIGAEFVINSTDPDFMDQLVSAVVATGARLGFDAIGGGKMAGHILTAIEQATIAGGLTGRYGSEVPKKVYIYGALDMSPTVLDRGFGMTWDLSGWLLFPFLNRIGPVRAEAMRQRVLAGLNDVFTSHYKAKGNLEQMLTREAVVAYGSKRTGEKYLVLPNG